MLKPSRPATKALLRSLAPLKTAASPISERLSQLRCVVQPSACLTDFNTETFAQQLSIPVQDHSEDEQQAKNARENGLFLARQERWEDLVSALKDADSLRAATGLGLPIADLLAFGARSDVVNGVERALEHCSSPEDGQLLAGVMALEEARQDLAQDPCMVALVALTHLDLGWAWRSDAAQKLASRSFENRVQAHFKRARTLMAPLRAEVQDSPFLLSAYCAAMATQTTAPVKLADAFAQLIELDPLNYRNMRALGMAMAPSRHGKTDLLELEARRTAARTETIWGAGGYTWTYFDVLLCDEQACLSLDVPLFLDGLRDIVENRPSQETVNLLIAFCAIGLGQHDGTLPEATTVRRQIAAASDWLTRDHLQELHPFHWAHAASGFTNNAHVASPQGFAAQGQADAHQFLQQCFRKELSKGLHVQFTQAGLEVHPA